MGWFCLIRPLTLTVVLGGLFLHAAEDGVTGDIQVPLDQAIEADDYADYKTARLRFRQAYESAISLEAGPSVEWRICSLWVHSEAVSGNLGAAQQTIRACIKRFDDGAAHLPAAEARLFLAEVRAARQRADAALETFREILLLLEKLHPVDRSNVLGDMSEFYLSVDMQAAGSNLLEAAKDELTSVADPHDARYVDATIELARVYRIYDRRWLGKEMLEPIVEHAREQARAGNLADDELTASWRAAGSLYSSHLRDGGDDRRAKLLSAETRTWKRTRGRTGTPDRAKSGSRQVSKPKLIKKIEPRYSPGGSAARVQGKVHLSLEVWPDGRAHNVKVTQPLPYGLSWNAIRAVRRWRFEPGSSDGKPTMVRAHVQMSFRFR